MDLGNLDVKALKAGDTVSISGMIYTGRDRLHKYLAEGGKLPSNIDFSSGALYHCGPVVIKSGDAWQVLAAGPTTSIREEPYEAEIIEKFRVRVIIGKGGMGEKTKIACSKFGCVYLQAVGGAASAIAASIKEVKNVDFFDEFGAAEALWHFKVENFTAIVGIDTNGGSLYEQIKEKSQQRLRELYEIR